MTFANIPLAQLHLHPMNVRRSAVADDEMVESIRSLGVLVPLTVAPASDGDGYIVIAGHRRHDGATKADLTQVPAVIREDLVTEAQQVEAMLVENLHREDLTTMEEAAAYEQLELFGMDAAAIAKATGRNVSTVKSRLKLVALPESARERLHDGEITLGDAEALLDFADDPDTQTRLEEQLGTNNFRWAVEDARRARDRAKKRAAQVTELQATGAAEVEETRDGSQRAVTAFRDEDLHDPAAHDGCLAYVVPGSLWQDPYLVCTDPARHPVTEEPVVAPVESEWEKRRAEREAEAAKHAAASAVRLAWLRDHFTGMFPTKSHQPLAAAAQAFLPLVILDGREAIDSSTLMAAFGVDVESGAYSELDEKKSAYAAGLTAAKPTQVLTAFGEFLAALVAEQLDTTTEWLDNADEIQHHLVLWDWIKGAGYTLSDVDKEIRTRLETKLAGLDTEAEAS